MEPALAGIRVLDLSRLLPGPFLTSVLADLGADVVKLEPPGVGDETRAIGPDLDGAGYAFTAVNRGKRSIVVDLKSKDGPGIALRLAARADVFVESFRPGVLDRLGLSDDALAAANPRLVRCSLVGYGHGEYRDDVGHDLNYQALAGILSPPHMPLTQAADLGGALYAATGILAALLQRERTGRGSRIEVALGDAAIAFNALPLAQAAAQRAARSPRAEGAGWELSGTLPCYRLYRCGDGRHVALAALERRFFARFATATGIDEALHFDTSPEAHATLERLFATRPAGEWVVTLRKAAVPITPVLSPEEVTTPPAPGRPLGARPTRPPPALGEHADDILRENGFADDEIRALRAGGAIP